MGDSRRGESHSAHMGMTAELRRCLMIGKWLANMQYAACMQRWNLPCTAPRQCLRYVPVVQVSELTRCLCGISVISGKRGIPIALELWRSNQITVENSRGVIIPRGAKLLSVCTSYREGFGGKK